MESGLTALPTALHLNAISVANLVHTILAIFLSELALNNLPGDILEIDTFLQPKFLFPDFNKIVQNQTSYMVEVSIDFFHWKTLFLAYLAPRLFLGLRLSLLRTGVAVVKLAFWDR